MPRGTPSIPARRATVPRPGWEKSPRRRLGGPCPDSTALRGSWTPSASPVHEGTPCRSTGHLVLPPTGLPLGETARPGVSPPAGVQPAPSSDRVGQRSCARARKPSFGLASGRSPGDDAYRAPGTAAAVNPPRRPARNSGGGRVSKGTRDVFRKASFGGARAFPILEDFVFTMPGVQSRGAKCGDMIVRYMRPHAIYSILVTRRKNRSKI